MTLGESRYEPDPVEVEVAVRSGHARQERAVQRTYQQLAAAE
jgi:hypothetical protein